MKKTLFALFICLLSLGLNAQISQYTTSTSGTVTITDTGQNVDLIHDAALTATLTVALPSTPFNGQRARISSVGGITALTITASTGTINNALTALTAGGSGLYMYLTATNKWYKL